jgi:hypothetical protein
MLLLAFGIYDAPSDATPGPPCAAPSGAANAARSSALIDSYILRGRLTVDALKWYEDLHRRR